MILIGDTLIKSYPTVDRSDGREEEGIRIIGMRGIRRMRGVRLKDKD
jgi:hypothetical protein